jgi:hypothetical protein
MYELRRDIKRLLRKRLPGSFITLDDSATCREIFDHFVDRICDSFDPATEKMLNARLEHKSFEDRKVLMREYSFSLSGFLAAVGDQYFASMSGATSVTSNMRIMLGHEVYNPEVLLQAVSDNWKTLEQIPVNCSHIRHG